MRTFTGIVSGSNENSPNSGLSRAAPLADNRPYFHAGQTQRQIVTALLLCASSDRSLRMAISKPSSRLLVSTGLALSIVLLCSVAYGPRGLGAGAVVGFLMLAWRHDTNLGLLFPLAILVVITFAVLLLLMYLMARMHS